MAPGGAEVLLSHAAMWTSALDRIGKQNDWKIIQITKPGCIALAEASGLARR